MQIEAGSEAALSVKLYGRLAFLLWRSVYITKQVHAFLGLSHTFSTYLCLEFGHA